MLVYVQQGFAETWPYKEKIRDGFRKYHFEEKTAYCMTGIKFVCEEKDVQAEIVKHVEEYIKDAKYAKGYSFDIPAGRYPDSDQYANGYHFEPKITYVKDLKMSRILELLTGEQFVRFCKETKQSIEEAIVNG